MKFLYNFGISQDDAESERMALDLHKGDRLVCLASAGEVPLNLLSSTDLRIDAVDISLPQLHLSRLKLIAAIHLEPLEAARLIGYMPGTKEERLHWFSHLIDYLDEAEKVFWNTHPVVFEKGPVHLGRFERYLAKFSWLALQIIGRKKMMKLFEFDDVNLQRNYFDEQLETRRLKLIFNAVFHPKIYKKRGMDEQGLTHSGERNIAAFFFGRFRDFCTSTPARFNYLLQFTFYNRVLFNEALPEYLLEKGNMGLRRKVDQVSYYNESVNERILKAPQGHYNKFALSNVGDWMTQDEMADLFRIIARQSAGQARLLLRYIHLAHAVPVDLRNIFSLNKEMGNNLEAKDRYPFYSLAPMGIGIK